MLTPHAMFALVALAMSEPDPVSAARTARQAAALQWMVVVGLIGVCMTVVIVVAMRLSKPRRGKPLRTNTRMRSAWVEAGKRLKVDGPTIGGEPFNDTEGLQ